MTIELDENLPDRLVSALTGLGHHVDTVYAERMNGRIDADVWNVTQTARRFFITQDLDFSDIRRYTPGTHAGLLLVRSLDASGRQVIVRHNIEDDGR